MVQFSLGVTVQQGSRSLYTHLEQPHAAGDSSMGENDHNDDEPYDSPSGGPTYRRGGAGSVAVQLESPRGERPDNEVACADCGLYRNLIGPLTFDGDVHETGDMVCRTCAESRGFDVPATARFPTNQQDNGCMDSQ